MKLSPIINASMAIFYISMVVLFMRFIESIRHDTPDTIVDAMGFISLLVASVAVMAFLFFYQPIVLLIENKKSEAMTYFLKTIGAFGFMTILILALTGIQ